MTIVLTVGTYVELNSLVQHSQYCNILNGTFLADVTVSLPIVMPVYLFCLAAAWSCGLVQPSSRVGVSKIGEFSRQV
jgi:hypothetical protein